jgi:hypothetical protein
VSTNLRPLASAILKAGILSDPILDEFRRWGFPIEEEEKRTTFSTFSDVVESIESALQSEGLVLERVTDVDLIQNYLRTMKMGTLHVQIADQTGEFPIAYGRTSLGEYIIPHKGDNIVEEMTNGMTHLKDLDGKEIYFATAREFFYGETKAFVVCAESGSA